MSKARASTQLNASGTPSASTFLRGDDTWGTPSASGGVGIASTHGDGTGDKSTSSTTYVAMSGIGAVSIAASAGDILEITFAGSLYVDTSTKRADVTCGVAGTPITDFGVVRATFPAVNSVIPVMFTRGYTVLSGDISGGNVSVDVRWKTPDTATISVGNDSASGIRPVLVVKNFGQ